MYVDEVILLVRGRSTGEVTTSGRQNREVGKDEDVDVLSIKNIDNNVEGKMSSSHARSK